MFSARAKFFLVLLSIAEAVRRYLKTIQNSGMLRLERAFVGLLDFAEI